MLHGYGSDQRFLKVSYEDDRSKALEDRTKYSTEELNEWEIVFPDGGGMTNPESFEMKQFPFPIDSTVRPRKTIYIPAVDPKIGEMSD